MKKISQTKFLNIKQNHQNSVYMSKPEIAPQRRYAMKRSYKEHKEKSSKTLRIFPKISFDVYRDQHYKHEEYKQADKIFAFFSLLLRMTVYRPLCSLW
jgi:hypothetical protein